MSHAITLRAAIGLACWLGITFVAASVGAIASIQAKAFYMTLLRPGWAPPAWLFGPVWTVLYILMGVAAWMVWQRHGFSGGGTALWTFLLQLALNALWTWLFFRLHLGGASVLEILVLWCVVLWTILDFLKLRPLAGVLLTPYLAWVTFAFCLTWAIWRRNPRLL